RCSPSISGSIAHRTRCSPSSSPSCLRKHCRSSSLSWKAWPCSNSCPLARLPRTCSTRSRPWRVTPFSHLRGDLMTDTWTALLDRLNEQSLRKHHDAYADIAWDSAELALDPTDPRFELTAEEPLGATAWYRALPAVER